MKKQLLLAALFAAFAVMPAIAQDKPTSAPAKPTLSSENVLALYCSTYSATPTLTNKQWGAQNYETLTLDGTNVIFTPAMAWEAFAVTTDESTIDVSEYEKMHIDLWVPQASKLNIKIEGPTFQNSISFTLNEGWNTIDCDPAWWNKEDATYDWKDLKYIILEQYKLADGETSAEGKALALTNIYFWKTPAPIGDKPTSVPAAPNHAENNVLALFSTTYSATTLTAKSWGVQNWETLDINGTAVMYTPTMAWDAFALNAEDNSGDVSAYEKLHVDLWVPQASKMNIKIEGPSFQNSISFTLNEG
ncbi:MAG: hypothetical protein IJS05_04540, partial [Paludibacteraceae bacterium]|nr:hypothetical protein [Paludibacteraceae bacterium]